MKTFEGKGVIKATVVADSVSPDGKRITTFELEYPRFIHAEFMTHRLISRNAASSRAIPVEKMLQKISEEPAMPIHWGKNQAGMQADEENKTKVTLGMFRKAEHLIYNDLWEKYGYTTSPNNAWSQAATMMCDVAHQFSEAGYHKQVVNRLTEPFQIMKVVATATEWDNFFWLRRHKDAQPEIQELANCMWEVREKSDPLLLEAEEYHVPYVKKGKELGERFKCFHYWVETEKAVSCQINLVAEDGKLYHPISEKEALKVSASCCAQVSYRSLDTSVEKAVKIYDALVSSKPVHASPFEHQAKPLIIPEYYSDMYDAPEGTTHQDIDGSFWSGNFKGFIQHRQLIPENACWEYNDDN